MKKRILMTVFLCISMIPILYFSNRNHIVLKQNRNKQTKIYYEKNGRRIYTYSVTNIKLNNKELNSYDNAFERIETLKKKLRQDEIYKDGGSIMYKGKKISILMCHTLDDNYDIYIGPETMSYENHFCTN